MPEAKKKLGLYIIGAFFLNIFAIMSVGAMCVMLVGNMLHNIREIKTESEHVFKADIINNKVHKIIYSINKAVINDDQSHLQYAADIIVDAIDETNTFIIKKHWNKDEEVEFEYLRDTLSHLVKIRDTISLLLSKASVSGTFDETKIRKLEKLGNNIQILSEKLRDMHSPIVASLVDDSYYKMRFILVLYLLSSFIGILASIVAYMVLTRNTITPILSLAKATKEVAGGDLSVRVNTESSTEIGALFDSFNVMTERLEGHAREREEFSRELERIVEKRTKELRDANTTLRDAQSELVRMEKIATIGQIAASVNHEIKTPLNSLYLNLQLLTRKINKQHWPEDSDKNNLLEVTATIDKEILRISDILEEFVQYARFAPPKTSEVDINSILQELTSMIGESAKDANVELKFELHPDPLPALLDRKKITQALLNLCVNAIHAMPDGGSLTIQSGLSSENSLFIKIKDTGTGIAQDDLEKIFEPFFTMKEKGMGFGLPIVKRIIEDHKGTITCSSRIGEYTEFLVALPSVPAFRDKPL